MEESQIRKELYRSFILLCGAVLLPVFLLYIGPIPPKEAYSIWFQRSGSIIIMFTVFAEYRLSKVQGELYPSGAIWLHQDKHGKEFGKYYIPLKIGVVFMAILGTLIWGYGDIIYDLVFF